MERCSDGTGAIASITRLVRDKDLKPGDRLPAEAPLSETATGVSDGDPRGGGASSRRSWRWQAPDGHQLDDASMPLMIEHGVTRRHLRRTLPGDQTMSGEATLGPRSAIQETFSKLLLACERMALFSRRVSAPECSQTYHPRVKTSSVQQIARCNFSNCKRGMTVRSARGTDAPNR